MATTIQFRTTIDPRHEVMARREARSLALARNEARRILAAERVAARAERRGGSR